MKTLSNHKGLAMVEFTILLPLLLFLMITTVEIGRAFYTYTELEKCSRDAARYLSGVLIQDDLGSDTIPEDIKAKTVNLAVYGITAGGTDSLLPSLSAEHVSVDLIDDRIQVEIVYPFKPVINKIPNFLNSSIDLNFSMTSSYTMRLLQ